MLVLERPSSGLGRRPPLWVMALWMLPSTKFAATEAVLRATAPSSAGAKDLTFGNLEFTWRYYARLIRLLSPRYRRRLRRNTEVIGHLALSRALESGAGAVLVSTHLGEMEVAAAWLTEVAKRDVVAVVDTVSPWWRQLFFDRVRRACGVRLRRQEEVTIEALADDLAAGRIVLLMLDRRCRSAVVSASFMGRQADLPTAAWALSIKAEAPVLIGTTVRSANGGCTLRFGDPREADESRRLGAGGLIRALAADLEAEIRRAPDQWHIPADLRQLPFLVPRPEPARTPQSTLPANGLGSELELT